MKYSLLWFYKVKYISLYHFGFQESSVSEDLFLSSKIPVENLEVKKEASSP